MTRQELEEQAIDYGWYRIMKTDIKEASIQSLNAFILDQMGK